MTNCKSRLNAMCSKVIAHFGSSHFGSRSVWLQCLCASVISAIDRMPLSQEQIDALKNPETMITIQVENPKKPGSKAAERFALYKAATTIQDATIKGANWQDSSSDFEKGFLKAPEGTPDREAEARSKIQSTDLVPKALPELTESVSKVEMSAATISLLRTMIRDEIKNGMLEMEHRFSAKLDNAIGEVKEELCVERASRQQLEERVAQLEQQHVREQAASTAQMFDDEDVDKSVVVVGGFGDQALEDAEALVQQMMVGIAGFKEVDMVNVEQPIALATFDTPASALEFIRTQKKNHIIQTNKLWAAENRSKTERSRCKIVSKLKKYMIELGGFQARDVITSYKLFRINARVSGKILPVATVTEACELIWCNDAVPTVQVREALDSFVRELE